MNNNNDKMDFFIERNNICIDELEKIKFIGKNFIEKVDEFLVFFRELGGLLVKAREKEEMYLQQRKNYETAKEENKNSEFARLVGVHKQYDEARYLVEKKMESMEKQIKNKKNAVRFNPSRKDITLRQTVNILTEYK